jgi:hypothetical protein
VITGDKPFRYWVRITYFGDCLHYHEHNFDVYSKIYTEEYPVT